MKTIQIPTSYGPNETHRTIMELGRDITQDDSLPLSSPIIAFGEIPLDTSSSSEPRKVPKQSNPGVPIGQIVAGEDPALVFFWPEEYPDCDTPSRDIKKESEVLQEEQKLPLDPQGRILNLEQKVKTLDAERCFRRAQSEEFMDRLQREIRIREALELSCETKGIKITQLIADYEGKLADARLRRDNEFSAISEEFRSRDKQLEEIQAALVLRNQQFEALQRELQEMKGHGV